MEPGLGDASRRFDVSVGARDEVGTDPFGGAIRLAH
jgi:hypothetical protein